MTDFAKVALVSDVGWKRSAARLVAPPIRCPVRVFALSELGAASAWVDDPRAAEPLGPKVEATRRLATLEDRTPPVD